MQRKVKMAYRVKNLGKIKQIYTHASIDDETKSLKQEPREREIAMYMVYFPAGHSIRIDEAELKRMGFDKKPRAIDMETGDVVDMGGDPWDFAVADDEDNIVLEDDDASEVDSPRARRKA